MRGIMSVREVETSLQGQNLIERLRRYNDKKIMKQLVILGLIGSIKL